MPKKTKKTNKNQEFTQPRPPNKPATYEEPTTSPYKFMALFFGIPTVILGAAIIVRLTGAS